MGENVSIAGLAAGVHKISVWFYQEEGSSIIWDSNNSENYNAEFTVPPFSPIFHGTPNGNLSWSKSNTENVLVVQTTNLTWKPVTGTSYREFQPEGVTLIYWGDGTSCSLGNGEGVYKIYSVDGDNNYSSGITIPGGQTITLGSNITLEDDLYLSNTTELVGEAKSLTANKIYAKIAVPTSDKWYFIGLPFAVKRITDTAGNELTMGLGDNDDYAIAYYDESRRADSGTGWTDLQNTPSETNTLPARGYIFWINGTKVTDLTLILEGATNTVAVNNSAIDNVVYTEGNQTAPHRGWNLIANPLLSTATAALEEGQFIYIYNHDNDSYTPSGGTNVSVKPFDSYFVKTASEKTSVSFATATQSFVPQSAPGRGENMTVY
jgi:hypothetical protein